VKGRGGRLCDYYQGVTLGGHQPAKSETSSDLGNHVVVGVGAHVIGAITIGDNTASEPGSVVIKAAPANATIVGIPDVSSPMHDPETDTIMHLPDPVGEKIDNLEKRIKELEAAASR